jgi:carbon starvation protein
VPLAWDAVVTLTASYQKVFSDNPKIGFFAQRNAFQDAIADGKVLPPAKSMDNMHAVVTNSTVDGILSALFAVMIIIVIADAARIWIKAIRAGGKLPTFEAPHVRSRLVAPAGLIPTAEDRAALAAAGGRFERAGERETAPTGGGP